MCGITGYWRFGGLARDELAAKNRAMTSAIAYRGPDGDGHWEEAESGIALGHRRLAIVDLSPTGHQPMASADGRFVITYNGELYNTREIASELNIRFRGTSDTEVLVEAIAKFGIDGALARANGLFAFAAFDRANRVLYLARDRMGIKPLYWTQQNGVFAFASELKALKAAGGLAFDIDKDAVAAYLRHACVPAPHSIYAQVHKLLPAERLEVSPERLEQHLYWDLAAIARERQARITRKSFETVVDELDELLRDAVRRQMVADVPLGAFLSGGIDSATVVALMRATSNGPVRTFSIGFKEDAFNEADNARAVAERLGTNHTELILMPERALDIVPKLPDIYDEPFADSSQIPTYLVSQLARQHVTVALSGDGGDEGFAGYVRYRGAPALWSMLKCMPLFARSFGSRAIGALSPEAWDSISAAVPRRMRPAHFGDKILKAGNLLTASNLIDMYHRLISQWPDPCGLMHRPEGAMGWAERMEDEVAALEPAAQLRLLDMMTYLHDDILTKVDRASMATSLEVRVPLLDHRVIEYAWGLPVDQLVSGGKGKRPLRAVLQRYLPKGLIERPKMGFGVPIGAWMRGPLRAWAEDLLFPPAQADHGLFDRTLIRCRWNEHQSGRRNWQHALWTVLQFEAWRRANA